MKKIGIVLIVVGCFMSGLGLGMRVTEKSVEPKVVTQKETIVKEVIPDGYIKLDEVIPLNDVNGWFMDKDDYLCFEIGDIGYQLEDTSNLSYDDICQKLPHLTELE